MVIKACVVGGTIRAKLSGLQTCNLKYQSVGHEVQSAGFKVQTVGVQVQTVGNEIACWRSQICDEQVNGSA